MIPKDLTPIVIGVADIKNSSLKPEDALEPMLLMLQAIQQAAEDTSLPTDAIKDLLSRIDSLSVVKTWTWPYDDLPSLLADNLGARPQYTTYTDNGGNSPARIFDESARRISQGQSKVAVVTGGEALASCRWTFGRRLFILLILYLDVVGAYMAAKKAAPEGWTKPPQSVTSSFKVSTDLLPSGK